MVLEIDTHRVVASEVDELERALPDMGGTLIRTGAGTCPSRVHVWKQPSLTAAHIDIGFPIAGTVQTASDRLVLAIALRSPASGRWDAIGTQPGQVFVYPPAERHQAQNPVGMSVGLLSIPMASAHRVATACGLKLRRPRKTVLSVTQGADLVGRFRSLARESPHQPLADEHEVDELLAEAVALVASDQSGATRTSRRSSSQRIMSVALDVLDETQQWQPSIPEFCKLVGTSERRLQLACRDVFDMTPVEFLRGRALSSVRIHLLDADAQADRVTRIAHDHGFRHLGRFACDYRAVFGESPSTTLRHGRRPLALSSAAEPGRAESGWSC